MNSQSPSNEPTDTKGGRETILLIEDEESLSRVLQLILASKGYNVLTAQDGEEGLEMYRKHQAEIQLVLSDLGLPRLSGEEVVKRIRSLNPLARIIVASGFIDPNLKSELFKMGLKNFIQKPYLPNDVIRAIREVLDLPT
jgi:DNA-binding response OmpR family regulator